MKNQMSDLTNHLFGMLEQVSNPTDEHGDALTDDAVRMLLARGGMAVQISRALLDAGRLSLDAARLVADDPNARLPSTLGLDSHSRPALPAPPRGVK